MNDAVHPRVGPNKSDIQKTGINKPASGYLISAPWRSSGKTLVSIGLARAAKRRSHAIQTFKKGPDFIDPLWLAAASGTGCYNLDPYVQQEDELVETLRRHADSQSLALVEGTMGLHDGLRGDGSDSNAAIARLLDLPVILVVDCRGMHRTVAALVNGIVQFDPNTCFAGIVLNRIRSCRHEAKIQAAIANYCDTRVVGVIPESRSVHIDEQELGLTPVPEFGQAPLRSELGEVAFEACIDTAADLVSEHCDLDGLFSNVPTRSMPAARSTSSFETLSSRQSAEQSRKPALRIGLARDQAFHFYYQDDLDVLCERGVEIVELSPVHDELPEDLDGLLIGGGFPERHAQALQDNHGFRQSLQHQINSGLVVHAECAGLMYLCRCLILDAGNFAMVGCIDADVTMGKKPVGRGYVQLQRNHDGKQNTQHPAQYPAQYKASPNLDESAGGEQVIYAHEFHHSSISFDQPRAFSYQVLRGYGIDGKSDGVVYANAHASYAHFRHTRSNPYLDRFLQRVIDEKRRRQTAGSGQVSIEH